VREIRTNDTHSSKHSLKEWKRIYTSVGMAWRKLKPRGRERESSNWMERGGAITNEPTVRNFREALKLHALLGAR